jgi:hypothetical protein
MIKTEKQIQELIIKMRNKGKTIAEISQEIGRSMNYVYTRLNKNYYPKKIRGD